MNHSETDLINDLVLDQKNIVTLLTIICDLEMCLTGMTSSSVVALLKQQLQHLTPFNSVEICGFISGTAFLIISIYNTLDLT